MANIAEYIFHHPGFGVPGIDPEGVPLQFIISDPELVVLPENKLLLDKETYILCRRVMVKSPNEQYFTEYIQGTVLCTISDPNTVHVLSGFISKLSDIIKPHEICNMEECNSTVNYKMELFNGFLVGMPHNLTAGMGDMRFEVGENFWKDNQLKDALLTGTFKFRLLPIGSDGTLTSERDIINNVMKDGCWILIVEMISGTATLLEHLV